ncbi:hypothetical protein [Rhodococcoides yunnanense]|uniref:hypothetical protein n=1 Tax=Rhodococcoides yunnanense TaxID=278209 RepID=UPI001FEC1E66|nr:hypothetical protein [Rhodococcus yunnanensis]
MGVGAKTIADRTAGGPWQRFLPALVLLHNGQPSRLQRNTGAIMYGGSNAMLSGRAGLALHGFGSSTLPTETLLLIPHQEHRKNVSFVEVERTWRLPGPTMKMGLPVAPLKRCLLDAARRMVDERACTALIADVVQRGQADIPSLLQELDEGCGRGSALPRRILRELSFGAHSVAELDAQKLYEKSGLPPMVRNKAVLSETGEFLGYTDNWLDEVALDWEIESFEFHSSPAAYEATLKKRQNMRGHGAIVVSHTPKAIRTQSDVVLADLHKAYQQALSRPRPNLRVVERDDVSYGKAS